MKILRKLYLRLFPQYEILERKMLAYYEADRILRETAGKEESERWQLDTEKEDNNKIVGIVYLCRKKRITE